MKIAERALIDLATQVLESANVAPDNAHTVAEALVAADMDGLTSHGVSRLPAYADQACSGKVDGRAVPEVSRVAPSAIRVDARTGFAFPAIRQGLSAAADCANESGVIALVIANSHHFGVAGHHVEHIARAGLVGLGLGNSPAAIAPWGGAHGVFGTNPIAFAAPRRNCDPLVVDLSLSKVARGKVMVARQRGEMIPEHWGLDAQGRDTTDPAAVLDGGTMVPLGGAKGAALALVVEILSAALAGSHFGFEASSFFDPEGPAPSVGQFFLLIDPARLAGESFSERLEVLLGAITDQPGTRLPGSRRLRLRARNRVEGMEIDDGLISELERRAGQTSP